MQKSTLYIPLVILFLTACNHYTPKPSGYFRIETGKHAYRNYQSEHFSFDYSTQARIESLPAEKDERWFNILYPLFGARIYCSYRPIHPEDFIPAMEDSRKFVYKHAVKADDIQMQVYENQEMKISGVIYEIKGDVASPIQFTVSDSIAHFFRGAVYFDCIPNPDSIAPSLNFIREDIGTLIESFRFY